MDNKKATYYYSSEDSIDSIKRIREKYEPVREEEEAIRKIRKLDKKVSSTALTVSLIAGIVGTLIFGAGLSILLLNPEEKFIGGLVSGIIGIIIMISAYPLNRLTFKHMQKKIAPHIIRLTDKILNNP